MTFAHAAPLPLSAILGGVENDPALMAEYADLDAARGEHQARESEAGWQVFGAASIGDYHELVVGDVVDNYYGRNVGLGVRYPLLGSLKRQLDAVTSSEFAIQRQQAQIALRRAERKLALRTAYADWWRAQQEQSLCTPLRAAADRALDQLRRREHARWMLTSEAGLTRSEWQRVLRPCAMIPALETDSRTRLEMLARVPVPASTSAVDEPIAATPEPIASWESLLDRNPRMVDQTSRLGETQRNRAQRWYDNVESNASLGYYVGSRPGVPFVGHSLVASLNFSMPFDVMGATSARRSAGEARERAALARLEAERRNLVIELGRALRLHRDAALDWQQSTERLAAAAQQLRERQARAGLDGGQALLQIQAAEREYYLAGFARIAAWHQLWTQEAALRLFSEGDPQAEALLGNDRLRWQAQAAATAPAAVGMQTEPGQVQRAHSGWQQGIYIWQSEALLDPSRRAAELSALRVAGMRHLYVGLSSRQVRSLADTKAALRALLEAAASQDQQVSLLLGDPAWLRPEGRGGLLDLVKSLKDLPFAGLHLDLEVEQLGWPVPDDRLRAWIDTVAAVSRVSPWPVALSSHYRWFTAPASGQTCVPCALPALGVRQVSLMIYTRNAQRSAAQATEIAQRWPDLVFRLAQSVEPQLPPEQSWAGQSRGQLDQQIESWRAALAPQGITGIDWQDWRSFPRQSQNTGQP